MALLTEGPLPVVKQASAWMARWFPRLVMSLFFLSLISGMLVPVYSDEVGWRLQERSGIDGLDKLYSQQCGPSTLAIPPWFMWPVRLYSAFFNTRFPEPFWVRVSGVGYAVVWAGLLLALIRTIAPGRNDRTNLTIMALGLMGLGTIPWLLVWSRPEQPILLSLTGTLLLAFQAWQSRQETAVWHANLRLLGIVVMIGISLSYHFKALIFLPVVLACVVMCYRRGANGLPVALASVAVVGLAFISARYWFGRMACPGDPVLSAQHNAQTLALQLTTDPRGLIHLAESLIQNFNLPMYVAMTAPGPTPMSAWLPQFLVSQPAMVKWRIAMVAAWAICLIFAAISAIVSARDGWRKRRLDPRLPLAIILLGTASVWCMTQLVRNVYEAVFVLPMLLLAYLVALSMRSTAALKWPARAIGGAMIVSQCITATIYGPALISAAHHAGYVANQPLSLSVADYAPVRAMVLRTAKACNIAAPDRARHLLLDDLTYFAFMRSHLPDHQISVLDPHWNGNIKNPIQYLNSEHIEGVILGCQWLAPDLRHRAHQVGAFCCLAPADWQRP